MADGQTVRPDAVRAKYRPARGRTGRTATFRDDFQVVRFARCWNGVNAFLPGSTRVAMPLRRGACPATRPVSIPALTLEVSYPTDGLPHAWSLHSGSTAGYHADFMNGWEPGAIARLAGPPRRA